MESTSYYTLLKIAPEASQAEIEQAYQRLLAYLGQQLHAGTPPPAAEFGRLDTAFAVLRDPARRQEYDRRLSSSTPSTPPPPPQAPDTPFTHAAAPAAGGGSLQFVFHGQGGEYFRIWIVNLLLSIVTLGIYSAWAKVRREQYFHRNLVLDGAGFDYHGKPVAILKGRIIAVMLFAAVSASQHVSLTLYLCALLAGMFAVPWIIMRSTRFRAHNSSYRGLRFAFVGTYGGALRAYVGYGFITIITLGFGTAMWLREMHKYLINNLRYGHGQFHCQLLAADIFIYMLKAWVAVIAAVALSVALTAVSPLLAIVGTIIMVLTYIGIFPYMQMSLANYIWSRTKLDTHEFSSTMQLKPYIGITLKNWLLTLLTLGLYWPWAKIAITRYRAACTGLAVVGSLDHFMAVAAEHEGAAGDAAADVFDFDIAI